MRHRPTPVVATVVAVALTLLVVVEAAGGLGANGALLRASWRTAGDRPETTLTVHTAAGPSWQLHTRTYEPGGLALDLAAAGDDVGLQLRSLSDTGGVYANTTAVRRGPGPVPPLLAPLTDPSGSWQPVAVDTDPEALLDLLELPSARQAMGRYFEQAAWVDDPHLPRPVTAAFTPPSERARWVSVPVRTDAVRDDLVTLAGHLDVRASVAMSLLSPEMVGEASAELLVLLDDGRVHAVVWDLSGIVEQVVETAAAAGRFAPDWARDTDPGPVWVTFTVGS